MLICDGCTREAKRDLKIILGDGILQDKVALCVDCLNAVCDDIKEAVRRRLPDFLSDIVPSLTPDQSKAVRVWMRRKGVDV